MKPLALALFAALLISPITSIPAQAGGAEEIEYRKAVMMSVGGHFGAIKSIVTGKVTHTGDLVPHAKALHKMAKISQHLFPESSGPDAGKTQARPKIWAEWAEFKKVNERFIVETAALVKAAETGDLKQALEAFGSVGKHSCAGCHKPYRDKSK